MRTLLTFLVLATLARAGDLPWIGVVWQEVSKKEKEKVGLPGQVGFQVGKVVPDGPLARAMGRKGDIWWKFDGQILVSKCQLVVLLRSKKPGDEAPVEFYRDGKPQSLQLSLGARPEDKMYSLAYRPHENFTSRTLLTRREEVARLSANGHHFALRRDGEILKFEVREGDRVLLDESFREETLREQVPAKWLDSYLVLKLTLDRPASPAASPEKRRVRYVPRNQGSRE